jgi:hypothetical protein
VSYPQSPWPPPAAPQATQQPGGYHLPYPTLGTTAAPPPPPNRNVGLNIGLIALGLLLVIGIGGAGVWYVNRANTEPPRVSASTSDAPPSPSLAVVPPGPKYAIALPQRLAGVSRLADSRLRPQVDKFADYIRLLLGTPTVEIAFYGNQNLLLAVIVGTGPIADPKAEIWQIAKSDDGRKDPAAKEVDPGVAGGVAVCGNDNYPGQIASSICAVADQGSVFILLADGKDAGWTAGVLGSARSQTLHPA